MNEELDDRRSRRAVLADQNRLTLLDQINLEARSGIAVGEYGPEQNPAIEPIPHGQALVPVSAENVPRLREELTARSMPALLTSFLNSLVSGCDAGDSRAMKLAAQILGLAGNPKGGGGVFINVQQTNNTAVSTQGRSFDDIIRQIEEREKAEQQPQPRVIDV